MHLFHEAHTDKYIYIYIKPINWENGDKSLKWKEAAGGGNDCNCKQIVYDNENSGTSVQRVRGLRYLPVIVLMEERDILQVIQFSMNVQSPVQPSAIIHVYVG